MSINQQFIQDGTIRSTIRSSLLVSNNKIAFLIYSFLTFQCACLDAHSSILKACFSPPSLAQRLFEVLVCIGLNTAVISNGIFLLLRWSELIIEFSKMNAQIKSKNFVGKLEYLLQEPSYQRIITWSDKNTVIEVLDSAKMQKEILPFYFRHQKFESFVRQLNLYGFKKLKSAERQRFTHHLLQAGTRLSEITSCKTSKGSSASSDGKGVLLIEKTLSQTAPSPQASHQKVGGSAFTIYNPLSQNRRNIFIGQNNSLKSQPSTWSNQSADGNIMVFPGQYLVWNWMQSFNRSYVGNILLSQRRQQQQQRIAQP